MGNIFNRSNTEEKSESKNVWTEVLADIGYVTLGGVKNVT